MTENKNEDPKKTTSQCEHNWKAIGETHMKTHVQLIGTKCGEKKEIEQFPF